MVRKKPKAPPPAADEPPKPKPLAVTESARFGRDVKRMAKRGADLIKLREMVVRLSTRQPMDRRHVDHALKGEWVGCRDCHVAPDWVLIYEVAETELVLHATGTHADLFG